jgi:ABC-type spermidine/putrescine transport system permease subunit II
MWEAIRVEFTPEVAVAATLLILVAVVLFAAARLARPPRTQVLP